VRIFLLNKRERTVGET